MSRSTASAERRRHAAPSRLTPGIRRATLASAAGVGIVVLQAAAAGSAHAAVRASTASAADPSPTAGPAKPDTAAVDDPAEPAEPTPVAAEAAPAPARPAVAPRHNPVAASAQPRGGSGGSGAVADMSKDRPARGTATGRAGAGDLVRTANGRHWAPRGARVPADPAASPVMNAGSGGVSDGRGTAGDGGVLEMNNSGGNTGSSSLVWVGRDEPDAPAGRHARPSGRHARTHRGGLVNLAHQAADASRAVAPQPAAPEAKSPTGSLIAVGQGGNAHGDADGGRGSVVSAGNAGQTSKDQGGRHRRENSAFVGPATAAPPFKAGDARRDHGSRSAGAPPFNRDENGAFIAVFNGAKDRRRHVVDLGNGPADENRDAPGIRVGHGSNGEDAGPVAHDHADHGSYAEGVVLAAFNGGDAPGARSRHGDVVPLASVGNGGRGADDGARIPRQRTGRNEGLVDVANGGDGAATGAAPSAGPSVLLQAFDGGDGGGTDGSGGPAALLATGNGGSAAEGGGWGGHGGAGSALSIGNGGDGGYGGAHHGLAGGRGSILTLADGGDGGSGFGLGDGGPGGRGSLLDLIYGQRGGSGTQLAQGASGGRGQAVEIGDHEAEHSVPEHSSRPERARHAAPVAEAHEDAPAAAPDDDAPRYRFGYDDLGAGGEGTRWGTDRGWRDGRSVRTHQLLPGAAGGAMVLPRTGHDSGGAAEAGSLAFGLMLAGAALRRFRRA